MTKIDEHGDVQKVVLSATTTTGLLEIANIDTEIYKWLSLTVLKMYRFGEAPEEKDLEKAFENCDSEILKSYVKTILEDAKNWSIQGRAGIRAGSIGGKASAAKRKKEEKKEITQSDIQAIKKAKMIAAI